MKSIDDFLSHISNEDFPDGEWSELIQALWWAKKGDWEMAHNIAQEVDSSNGSWVHAYLHRVEGDLGNAAYWYKRANKPSKFNESLDVEWTEISEAILFSN